MTDPEKENSPYHERVVLAGELALDLRADRESLMSDDPQLADELSRWNGDLARFVDELEQTPPDPRVWQRLVAAVETDAQATIPMENVGSGILTRLAGLFANLLFWRSLTGAALATSCALAMVLLIRTPVAPKLQTTAQQPTVSPPAIVVSSLLPREGPPVYVATYDALNKTVVVIPVAEKIGSKGFPHLWLVPNDNETPVSLAGLKTDSPQTIIVSDEQARLLNTSAGLVVTLEPQLRVEGEAQGPVIAHGRFSEL